MDTIETSFLFQKRTLKVDITKYTSTKLFGYILSQNSKIIYKACFPYIFSHDTKDNKWYVQKVLKPETKEVTQNEYINGNSDFSGNYGGHGYEEGQEFFDILFGFNFQHKFKKFMQNLLTPII